MSTPPGRDPDPLTTAQSPVEPAPAAPPAPRRSTRGGPFAKENRRLVAGLVIGALAAAFAVVNLDEVEVDWLVTTSQTPLIVVIALSFLLGAIVGWLASTVRRRKR